METKKDRCKKGRLACIVEGTEKARKTYLHQTRNWSVGIKGLVTRNDPTILVLQTNIQTKSEEWRFKDGDEVERKEGRVYAFFWKQKGLEFGTI